MTPWLLIPYYDHGPAILVVIDSLESAGLPASSSTTAAAPRRARCSPSSKPGTPGSRCTATRGTVARAARSRPVTGWRPQRGATHALQLDADGQHEAADVPRFLDAMRKHPDALVLGAPIFDESVPTSRLYGRQLSRALVWLFTLSFDVRDPLCGFRGVPLEPTLRLLDRMPLGDHMDFDPELAVRLIWDGLVVGTSRPACATRRAGSPTSTSWWTTSGSRGSTRASARASCAAPPASSRGGGGREPGAPGTRRARAPLGRDAPDRARARAPAGAHALRRRGRAQSALFRRADGRVPAWVALEWMAQCVAAHGGLVARALGEPVRPGLFLGTRGVRLRADDFGAEEVLEVRARHLRGELGLVAFACSLVRSGEAEAVAEGNLSVYVVDRIESLRSRALP